MKIKKLLVTLLALVVFTLTANSQIVTGDFTVCVGDTEDYLIQIDRANVWAFEISLVGGNKGGQTVNLIQCVSCPYVQGHYYNLTNVEWTSSGTKTLMVTLFGSSGNVISSTTKTISNAGSFPSISGPTTVFGDEAWFSVSGNFSNHSWSTLPGSAGLTVTSFGSSVRVSGISSSSSSWHMISLSVTNECGDTCYASKSFYKQ